MNRIRTLILPVIAACVVLVPSNHVDAGFDWYNQDFAGWQAASGSYTTIDFSGFANLTVITDQYSGSGVLFTGPQPNLAEYAPGGPSGGYIDDWGLNPQSYLEVTFLWPMHSIGAHVPGNPRIQLFLGNQLLYQTGYVGGDGLKFTGVTSGIAFDRVRILSFSTGASAFTDNLYFSTVPGPGPIVAMLAAAVLPRRRRR